MKNDNHETPLLATIGDDEDSEVNIARRLQFLRESSTGGTVFIPESWVKEDPAFQQAVEELDWLRVEKPTGER